ncbi:MAG: hypothetical protein E2O39_13925, partial [Planctomycetota bacterium]
ASVQELELVLLTEGVEYDLDPVTGTITETGGFGDGDALVTSYTSDFELQDVYPLTLNDGPDLTEVDGGWRGKSMVSGTYTLSMWGRRDLTLDVYGESNAYRELARGVGLDFLVGDATTIEPYDLIASQANCYACHVDIAFHGNNRRGFVACLACHGDAAAGDRTRYVAAGAPETEGVTIDFREMLHRIHMGEELTNASSYVVVGFGLGYPNNFSEHTYGEVVFPAMPSGTQACTTCHGANNTAWLAPGDRDHPTEQGQPVHAWRIVCGACHDSAAANAHYDIQTTASGVEACSVCHGPGAEFSVEAEHLVR